MKKIVYLLLILIFTLMLSSIALAAPEDVDTAMYGSEVMEIDEGNIPLSGELVQTGGIPSGIFYAAGGLCIVTALSLSRKKSKQTEK